MSKLDTIRPAIPCTFFPNPHLNIPYYTTIGTNIYSMLLKLERIQFISSHETMQRLLKIKYLEQAFPWILRLLPREKYRWDDPLK